MQLSKYLVEYILYAKRCIKICECHKSIYKTFSFLSKAQSIIMRVRYISVAHGPAVPEPLGMHVKNHISLITHKMSNLPSIWRKSEYLTTSVQISLDSGILCGLLYLRIIEPNHCFIKITITFSYFPLPNLLEKE